jgi:hypothetical protein
MAVSGLSRLHILKKLNGRFRQIVDITKESVSTLRGDGWVCMRGAKNEVGDSIEYSIPYRLVSLADYSLRQDRIILSIFLFSSLKSRRYW